MSKLLEMFFKKEVEQPMLPALPEPKPEKTETPDDYRERHARNRRNRAEYLRAIAREDRLALIRYRKELEQDVADGLIEVEEAEMLFQDYKETLLELNEKP